MCNLNATIQYANASLFVDIGSGSSLYCKFTRYVAVIDVNSHDCFVAMGSVLILLRGIVNFTLLRDLYGAFFADAILRRDSLLRKQPAAPHLNYVFGS